MRTLICVLVVGFVLLANSTVSAAITFSGSGTGADGGTVSASATFSVGDQLVMEGNHLVSAHILTIVLTNTTTTPTANNGQVLTGIVWSFDPLLNGTLALYPDSMHNPSLTANSHIWVVDAANSGNGQTSYKVDDTRALGGTWTDKTSNPAFTLGDYGYATTGADGMFQAGTIVGSKPGSANYGLVSATTYLQDPVTMANGVGPQSLPLVQNSITIQFRFMGDDPAVATFPAEFVSNVQFLVGTNGTHFGGSPPAPGPTPADVVLPEPASMGLWGLGLAIAAMAARRGRPRR
jgi:hypothetical protein